MVGREGGLTMALFLAETPQCHFCFNITNVCVLQSLQWLVEKPNRLTVLNKISVSLLEKKTHVSWEDGWLVSLVSRWLSRWVGWLGEREGGW